MIVLGSRQVRGSTSAAVQDRGEDPVIVPGSSLATLLGRPIAQVLGRERLHYNLEGAVAKYLEKRE